MWDLEPSLLGRFLPFVGHLPRGVDLDYTMSTSLLPSHCGSFFISLVVETLFC